MSKRKKSRKQPKRTAKKGNEPPATDTSESRGSGINRLGVTVAIVLLVGLAVAVAIVGKRPAARVGEGVDEVTTVEGADVEGSEKTVDISLSPTDYVRGSSSAPVTIVEFSDFECPYCKKASVSLEEVIKLFPDKVRLVFKNFPLDTACNPYIGSQLHPLACRAALMGRCAGRQGRFWEFHDAVFGLPELTANTLEKLPRSLGLDEKTLSRCIGEKEVASRIRADLDQGQKLGVVGTPAIFVNGREETNYSVGNLKFRVEHILSNREAHGSEVSK